MNILERFVTAEGRNNFDSKRWWQIFKKPSTIAVGSLAISCSVLGYIGTRWLVTEKLPPFLEKQLSKTIERPLEFGEVTSFSFNSITFGESTVSVNDDDPDYVTVDKVEVGFNLLPVITHRRLPLEVTLIDPNIYLEQDKNGTWLKLPDSDERERLPIDFDITVIAESGKVALQPNSQQNLIELELNGGVNYNQAQSGYIKYDLDLATGEAVATAEGKTRLTTGETEAQILVEDLSLSKLVALLPRKPPIDVRQGNLNADIDVVIPSVEKIDDTRIQGQVSLQKLKATAEQLDKPTTARSRLRFQDEKVEIDNTQASIGDIVANIDGRINWKTGYDANIVVPAFAINKLREIAPIVPVNAKGKLKANLELTGAITKPVLQGRISNTQPVTVAETKLDRVEAELTAGLEKAVLKNLSIIPAAGGKITGTGLIGNNSRKHTPLSFKLEAQLPAEKLLQPYYATDVPFNVGTVTATATVDGSLDNPEVLVDWQAPATTSAKTNISGSGKIIYDDSTLAINNTVIDIDSGKLNVSGTVDLADNSWQGVLNASNVPLNSWLQPLESEQLKLGEPVALSNGTVRLNGLLTQNLLDTVNGVANLNFAVGSGNVAFSSNVNSGKLDLVANATAVPVDNFVTGVELSSPVEAQLDVSANLDSLEKATINTNNLVVRVGEQTLNANGKIVLADLATNPDASVDLNLQTDSNLGTLPNQLLKNVSANHKFLADNFNLAGNASFKGRLQGKNILANPNNLDLTGDVRLEDLNLGNTAFEALVGTVDISPGEAITIDLQGKRDAIAVNLEPCTRKPCPISYLPTDIEIRQGEDTPEPIIATAKRQGEFLNIDVTNFPLSILNLQLGVPGKLAGELTGEALVNLFTFTATGEVRVIKPSIGYIDGEAFTADFAYSPEPNLAKLNAATLKFGESIYTLEGTYNSKTQEIAGELDLTQGYVQDLISAFGWYDIQRATELFQLPDVFDSASLSTLEVGKKDARVDYLLKLSVIVRERLEEIADRELIGTPLDIEGTYQGKVEITGSLDSPNVAWEIVGDNWLWDTDRDIVLEIPRSQGIMAIANLRVAGEYNNEGITLDTLSIQGTQSEIALSGQLRQEQVTAQYNLENLPIDAIQNFVDIPLEVAGKISTKGRVSQTLQNPSFVGDITLEQGRLKDRPLPKITGEYVYNNKRLELDTTETPSAKILASIPLPVEPGNDKISLEADIDEGGVALIDGFTRGALEFIGGEADITLNANTRLDLDADFIFQDLDATGNASLNNSILKTAASVEPLNITAEIALDEKLIQVKQLSGTFAQSKIAASGVLPIFESVESISQPLTLDIYESQIDLDRVYIGGIEGKVIITGNAFNPLIGGEIELFDGRAFVRDNEVVENPEKSAFKPLLKDLDVVLSDFKVQQAPLYNIALEGDLVLNASANNIPKITADGILNLTRADVDFVSNKFNLQQDYENIIVFNPHTSILNPSLDVRLTSKVAKLDNIDLGVVEDNEISDPISFANHNTTVYLLLKGEAERIIPRIGEDPDRLCLIEPPLKPLFAEDIYTQENLTQLAECVNSQAFEEGSVKELLNSSAVSLESNPPHSQGKILALLGNKFLNLAEELQNKNEKQLLEFGVTKFVLTPIEREVFSFADGIINNIGEEIGLNYFRVYPNLEGTYRLTKDSSINATYDYFSNEAQIRYQKQF